MNRLVRGSVLLAVAAWACGGDPTANNAAQPDQLIANPSVVFVNNTDSQAVLIDLFNSLGQQLGTDFTLGTVGPGLTVTRDTTFRHLSGQPPVNTEAQFIVRGTTTATFVSSSFTITAGGKTVTVPVKITPGTLIISFSNPTPALGEVVTLTAPPNVIFTDSSAITVGGSATAVVGVSPDGSQISFLLPPNITAATASITNIQLSYIPGQVFTVSTTGAVTTPVVASIPGTFSSASPQVGDTVTLTLDPLYRALPTVGITFGGPAALITGISADSSAVSFLPPPASSGAASLTNVIVNGVPVPLALPSTNTITVAATTTYTGTNALATAPTVAVPTVSGQTTGFFDLGSWAGSCSGAPCQWYKIVVPAAGDIDFSSLWDNQSDLGIYVVASNGTTAIGSCDAHGDGATAQPEACTITFAAAGTYYIQMQNFAPFYPDPDPAWFEITLTAP